MRSTRAVGLVQTSGRAAARALAAALWLAAALGCSAAAGPTRDGAADAQGDAPVDATLGCAKHHDCPQTQFCYEQRCVADPQLAVYHCGKQDPAGQDSCPPGRWCVTANDRRARCAESPSYPCQDACDCGPAHCCVEVPALGGRRCVKDPTDPFLPGGEPVAGARCTPGADASYCATDPACHAAQPAFAAAGRAGELLAWRRGDAPGRGATTSTCGAARCFGTSCQCAPGETCLDLAAQAPAPEQSCGLLAGGSCVSHALAEAVFGVDPRELLPCCSAAGCLPGERCDAGWAADHRYAYRRVVGRCGGCGDGTCDDGEYPGTCPQDCRCGDGRCAPVEVGSCQADCGFCGNGRCDPGEALSPPFYGGCAECTCGNGACEPDETPERCPADCRCGDGACSVGEQCPEDCVCEGSAYLSFDERVCGDGHCEAAVVACTDRETCLSCPADCGACAYEVSARTHATSGINAVDLADLSAAWAASGDDVFAGGEHGQLLRFDGERWTKAPALYKWIIRGLWGSSSADVFAVGEGGNSQPAARHFDGAAWQPVDTPPGVSLFAVWGDGKGAVRAVGAGGAILRLAASGAFVAEPTAGTSAELRGVWGSAAADLHAVGDGVLLHFDGAAWSARATSASLRAVWGGSPTAVYAVGDGGAILRFDGAAWSVMPSPTTRDLYAVWGRSADEVYAVGDGGTVLQLAGGGWRQIGAGVTRADLRGVHGDGRVVVAVGHGAILRYDEKLGWQAQTGPASARLRGIWGDATGHALAVGFGGTVLERRAAASPAEPPGWAPVTQTATAADLFAVWGSAPDDVYAVGKGGAMIRFDGATWRAVPLPTAEDLNGIWGSGATNIFVVGGAFNHSNAVLHFDGQAWKPLAVPFDKALYAVWGSGPNDVYAVGDRGEVLRYDGQTFAHVTTLGVSTTSLHGVWGTSASNVYVVGAHDALYRFDGRTWKADPHPKLPGTLWAIWGRGPDTVFAAGQSGALLRYDGARWRREQVDIRRPVAADVSLVGWGCDDIYGVWGASADELELVGDLGAITQLARVKP